MNRRVCRAVRMVMAGLHIGSRILHGDTVSRTLVGHDILPKGNGAYDEFLDWCGAQDFSALFV